MNTPRMGVGGGSILRKTPSKFVALTCLIVLVVTASIVIMLSNFDSSATQNAGSNFSWTKNSTSLGMNSDSEWFVTSKRNSELAEPENDSKTASRSDLNVRTNDKWVDLENALKTAHPTANYAIYAEDLNDTSRRIQVNAEIEMPLASVYKLSIAYSMLRAVANGTSWDSALWNTTLSQCFDIMIIESNNECAHAWGDMHGWKAVMDEFAELGLEINLYDQTTATAKDIAEFLKIVYRGEILNDALIDRLLSAMMTQNYRLGIPTGVQSAEVANKVGFMNNTLNDAGIVFGTDGDYVLVIFTDGHSWESIAETAGLIHDAY